MALIPTTFLRQPDVSKEMLRGTANAQMGILLNQMRLGGLNCGRRVVEYASGIKITCTVNFRDRHLDIIVPENLGGENISEEYVVGFLCHPGVAHAYDQVQATAEDRRDNQVVRYDATKAEWHAQDYVVRVTTTDLFGNIINVQDTGNEYGNVDWKGPKTDATTDPEQKLRKVLTWKGPPSRYWPLDTFTPVAGVTIVDHIIEGVLQDTYYYTPFSGKLYEHGRSLPMPNLYFPLGINSNYAAQVLGAAYREVDGKLVVVVKTCYNAYPREKAVGEMVSTWQVRYQGKFYQEWYEDKTGADAQALALGLDYESVEVPDPDRSYWFEVLLREPGASLPGWNRLLRVSTSSSYANTNWFFSEDGTKAATVLFGKIHKIVLTQDTDKVTTCAYTTEEVGSFKNTVAKTRIFENSEAAPDEQDPAQSGEFAAMYRVGMETGAWIGMSEYTDRYTSEKSGVVTMAVDYKGNKLVKMQATLTGAEVYDYYRKFGFKWGRTALPPRTQSDYERTPHDLRFHIDPFYSGLYESTGYFCMSVMGVCKPKYTASIGSEVSPGCFQFDPCATNMMENLSITVTVTDEAGGRKATLTKNYPITAAHLKGPWTVEYQSPCSPRFATTYAYKYAGKWLKVTYGVANIKTNAVILSPGDLYVGVEYFTKHPEWCAANVNLPSALPYPDAADGNHYVMVNATTIAPIVGVYYQRTEYQGFNCPPSAQISGSPSAVWIHGGCYGYHGPDDHSCIAPNWTGASGYRYQLGTSICHDYGSASYLTNMVDYYGNPISDPQDGEYKTAVFTVESPC